MKELLTCPAGRVLLKVREVTPGDVARAHGLPTLEVLRKPSVAGRARLGKRQYMSTKYIAVEKYIDINECLIMGVNICINNLQLRNFEIMTMKNNVDPTITYELCRYK